MKLKKSTKKAILMLLGVIMLLSIMSVTAFAAENDCPHIDSLGQDGWEIIKEPTCSSTGLKQKWCSQCVDYATVTIPNTPGENHVPGLWTETVQHSCTNEGKRELRCTKCLVLIKEETVPAHDFSVLYGDEPNCMKDGYTFSMCLTCYEMKTVTIEKDPTAHKYGEWQITREATCTVPGERTRYCLNHAVEGETVKYCTAADTESYTDEDNHVNVTWFEDETVEPTCTSDGYTPGVCADCQAELRKVLPMHSYSEYEVISKIPATCHIRGSEHRRCKCGLEYDVELELDKDNHVYTDWKISKEPGCQPGERYKACKYEYDVKIIETLPATGEHKYGEWNVTVEPTCSLVGTKEKECSICGDVVTADVPVKHDLAKWTTVTEMICDETKLQQGTRYAECDKCSYKTYFTVPAVHSFGAWRVTVKANCLNDKPGTKERVCSGCGKVETVQYYAEHDYTVWAVADKPVCATDSSTGKTGMYARMCRTCGKQETKSIPAEHDFGEWEVIVQPLCNNEGVVEKEGERVRSCKFCGITETENFDADHVYSEWKTVRLEDNKWVEDSEDNYNCGDSYTQLRTCYTCGIKDIRSVDKAHAYGNWYNPDGATCSEDEGSTAILTRKCARCPVTETTGVPVSLLHPNLKTIVTEATCTSSGYTKEYCPDCDHEKLIGEITPALGHDLDEKWTTRVEATCSTAGSRYKACSRCSFLDFQDIARTEHVQIQLEPGIDATCTTPGQTPKSYCGVCLKQFEHEVIPALGHTYPEGSETCSRCYAYAGSKDCACACHSTSGMEGIFFKIIVKLYQFFGINQECKCGVLHYDEPGFLAKLFGRG